MTQNLEKNKVCRVCGQDLPLSEFYKQKANKSGYESRCKSCNKAHSKKWATNNRDRRNAIEAKYRSKPDVIRRKTLKQYRLTQEDYNRILVLQDNCCAICLVPFEGVAHVDHDHSCCKGHISCGKCVRGLLCGKCNRGIGMFNDDLALLKAAIDYLVAGAHTLGYEVEVYDKLQNPKFRER